MKKNCKHCNKEFKPKRFDAKYCSEKCKNTYNNRTKSKAYHITKTINDIFWNNRSILCSFYKKSHKEGFIHINQLKRAGYNFNYFTHEYEADPKTRVIFCYDFGFQQINSKTLKIIYHEKIQIDEQY